jgi:hypothetical protein
VKTFLRLWYPAELFLKGEMLHMKVVEKIKTHVMFSNFPKLVPFVG